LILQVLGAQMGFVPPKNISLGGFILAHCTT